MKTSVGIGTNLVGALSENRNISQAKLEAPSPAASLYGRLYYEYAYIF
jgi:hypothetical protein